MKMQNVSLVESLPNADTSHWMSLKDPSVEGGCMSAGESASNLSQQSLPVVNSTRSCEGFSESSYSTSETSGSWGDFEGFRESSDESERFGHDPEVLVKSTKISSGADTDLSRASAGHFCSEPSLCSGTQEAPSSVNEVAFLDHSYGDAQSSKPPPHQYWRRKQHANHSYEDIFKLGFPEVFVSQSRENIRSLDQVLDTNSEDVGIPEFTKNQLCIDSENIWRTLKDIDNTPSLRHHWSKSHCQENLLSVLGIDANQKDFSESQDAFEESDVKDEDFRFDGLTINDCKALIQTKLAVSPDSRHGHLFTCNLFLKTTSSNGSMQYITVPRKKQVFNTHNLKMKFFSSDVC